MTDHFREAERLIEQAETWMDADIGWRASMSTRERVDRRTADFLGAIAHGVAGVLEALNAQPLEDPSTVRVPLLDLPTRDGRQGATS